MTGCHTEIRVQIESAIRRYLVLIDPDQQDADATLSLLAQAIDRLIAAYYAAPDIGPDMDGSRAPRVDDKPYADAAAAAFPQLGFYAVVEPECITEQEVGLGSGPDDLAEIAVDLIEVLWLFENDSENDAVWQFRWGYQNHWGRHAHELRLYLHTMCAW